MKRADPVWGMAEIKELRGFPEGRTHIRRRNSAYVRVYVRPIGGGIREYLVEDQAFAWWPCMETGSNTRISWDKMKQFEITRVRDGGGVLIKLSDGCTYRCRMYKPDNETPITKEENIIRMLAHRILELTKRGEEE